MKKILVTGAAGFIGFHLCETLIKENYLIIGLDNINDYYDVNLKFDRLKELGVEREKAAIFNKETSSNSFNNFKFIRLNLEDTDAISKLFEKEKYVFRDRLHLNNCRWSDNHTRTFIFDNILYCYCGDTNIHHGKADLWEDTGRKTYNGCKMDKLQTKEIYENISGRTIYNISYGICNFHIEFDLTNVYVTD